MDILYIIGTGSKHDNLELRYSLRSVAKYGRNVGRVIVAGYPPEWLSKEVATLKVEDKYSYKHSNILNVIEHAVDAGLVEGDFLYSSDDHFYCREVDFDNYPFYMKSERLISEITKPHDKHLRYHKSLIQTRILLQGHGLPLANYSQHLNTHMNADVIRDIRPLIHESYETEYGAEPTSLIMNAWMMLPNHPNEKKFVMRKDLKLTYAETVEDIEDIANRTEAFSISDKIFDGITIFQYFTKYFPDKCKYEM